ncbi:hypothetical protein ACJMK2_044433 [Sinanodonta woodiana]|uniref:FERM domain-containing protein n=1 Tax=Sinanodonta woodiana TaxID=1069815 RepID=A0ABD3W019_SINWO
MFRKSRSKSDLQTEYKCTIRFLDDSEPIQLDFTKETLGQTIQDKVCSSLNLEEKDYFGLRYVDAEKQRHWLEPLKSVYKQMKGVSPCVLCFRVKFYPADPMKLREEITRYYLFLQLRRDLHHGRLLCAPSDANLLAAYIIQSEVGDFDPQDHPPGYVTEFKMLPKQNVKMEEQIMEIHKSLIGQVPAEAEANFLKKAASLDTYGVDPHQVKDQKGTQLYLGCTHQGIMTFHGARRTQLYGWGQVKKITYKEKMFILHVNITEDSNQKNSKKKLQPIGYKCISVPACKYLWKCAVEQQFFFTLSTSMNVPKLKSGGTIFSRGSRFRFSGRCQNEAYQASEHIKRDEPNFQRSSSLPNFARKPGDHSKALRNSTLSSETVEEDKKRKNYRASPVKVPTAGLTKPKGEPAEIKGTESAVSQQITSTVRKNVESIPTRQAETAQKRRVMPPDTPLVLNVNTVQAETHIVQESEPSVMRITNADLAISVAKSPVVTSVVRESPVDVPGQEIVAEVLPTSPIIKAPVLSLDSGEVKEVIVPQKVGSVEAGHPTILVTSPSADFSQMEDMPSSYQPEMTLMDDFEQEVKSTKSLEDQVRELEEEYDRMQERNHVSPISSTPNKSERFDPVQSNKLESVINDTKVSTKESSKPTSTLPKSSGSSTCCKFVVYTSLFVVLTLTVTITIIMFSDVQHPLVNELRQHLSFLEPTRDFLRDKYHSLLRKY